MTFINRICPILALAAALITPAHADWASSPEIKALYEKAKKEGKVHVWGTTAGAVDWLPKAFGAAFPGIDVQFHGENDITTKAISEARAGRNQVDVFLNSLTGILPLVQRDLAANVDWTALGAPKDVAAFNGRAALTYNIAYTIAFNKAQVKAADAPKRWEDLLDPAYKGKMVSSIFLMPRLVGGLSLVWGKDKAIQFARSMINTNDTMVTRAPREPIISSGERIYGIGEIDSQVMRWQLAGLPIEYVVPEPVVLGQFLVTVLAKAPNPNAARLMAGWILSPEGKQAQANAVLINDYGPTGTSDIAKKIQSKQVQVVFDTPELMETRERAIAEMGPIISGQR